MSVNPNRLKYPCPKYLRDSESHGHPRDAEDSTEISGHVVINDPESSIYNGSTCTCNSHISHSTPLKCVELLSWEEKETLKNWLEDEIYPEMSRIKKTTSGMDLPRTQKCYRNRRILMYVYSNHLRIIENAIERMEFITFFCQEYSHEISLL